MVVLKAKNAVELLPSSSPPFSIETGDSPDRGDALEVYSGTEIRIEADPAFDIQYDGEPTRTKTPALARILPKAVRLIVSDEGYQLFR